MKKLIELDAAIDAVKQREWLTEDAKEILEEVLTQLPSAQADSKELSGTHKALDTVSRQAAIEAHKKHYKEDNVLVLKPESSQEDSLEKD